MGSKKVWTGIAIVFASGRLAVPAFAASAATCGTSSLAPASKAKSALHVLNLTATGISCDRAVSIVAPLVKDIADGKGVSVAGSAGISIMQSTANGLTDTHVTLTYPNGGQIGVAMAGRVKSVPGSETIPFPSLPDFPNIPFPNVPRLPPPSSSTGTLV